MTEHKGRLVFARRRFRNWFQLGFRRYDEREWLSRSYLWVAWCGPIQVTRFR